jgi:hypothetical protein
MSEIKKGILGQWTSTTTNDKPPFQIFLENNNLMQKKKQTVKNMTDREKEKVKEFVKGKFNHPEAAELIINFIETMNNEK